MPVHVDYIKYHQSVARELAAVKDRIRNLIGDKHWPTDGEHKEAVLRRLLRSYLPEYFQICRGFVCFPDGDVSNQIDILITGVESPTLFKDESLVIVTPDCVEAIIEVKTKFETKVRLEETLCKLAKDVEKVRRFKYSIADQQQIQKPYIDNSKRKSVWAGLFVFDHSSKFPENNISNQRKWYDRWSKNLLWALYSSCVPRIAPGQLERNAQIHEKITRRINCVSIGPNIFARYWDNGAQRINEFVQGPVWHSYLFKRYGPGSSAQYDGLAPAYFMSNLIWDISDDLSSAISPTWFPIQGQGGKEIFGNYFVSLVDGEIRPFRN